MQLCWRLVKGGEESVELVRSDGRRPVRRRGSRTHVELREQTMQTRRLLILECRERVRQHCSFVVLSERGEGRRGGVGEGRIVSEDVRVGG